MRLTREQLLFMALVAVDEAAEAARPAPIPRPFSLRLALALLYAFSDGNRAPFDAFWRACAEPDEVGQGVQRRAQALTWSVNGIFRSLGRAQTITLTDDIRAARTDPGRHAAAYARLHRRMQSEDEPARARFAELLRETGREAAVARVGAQRGKDCGWL